MMKLTAIILLSTCLAATANGYSQKVTLSERNAPLDVIFKKIKAQCGYTFVYRDEWFKHAKKVTLDMKDVLVTDALDACFKGQPFYYAIVERTVVIYKKDPLSSPAPSNLQSAAGPPPVDIKGKVVNEKGEPMEGVTVTVKGTFNSTSARANGEFTLTSVNENAVLVFSYIGYKTQEVPIKGKTKLTVTLVLNHNDITMSEVVITAIGVTQLKDQTGTTSSAIKKEDIAGSGEAGLINSLAGKASGVRIGKSNGDPGSGSVIQIRGSNTIQGASQPLIILDGIPVSNDNLGNINVSQQSRLDDINPNDIESVQVLKGASAAALWGSRAANGVIVIVTKNGAYEKKPVVQYSFTQSFDKINVFTPLQNKYGQGAGGVWNRTAQGSWGDKIVNRTGGDDVMNQTGAYFISDVTGSKIYPVTTKNATQTFLKENYDKVFQTGKYREHDVSIGGGGKKVSYFFSYGNLSQEGIIRNSDYTRHTVRLNTKVQITDKFSWNNKFTYTNTKSNRIAQAGENTNGILLGLLRNAPDFDITEYIGTYVAGGTAYQGRQRMYRRQIGENQSPDYNNPLWTIYQQRSGTEVNRFIMAPELQLEPLQWLNVIVRGGFDYYGDDRSTFFPTGSSSSLRSLGRWEKDDITSREMNLDAIVKASRDISKDISLTATVGVNYNDRYRSTNSNVLTSFAVNAALPSTILNPDPAASTWDRTITDIRSNRGYGILAFNLFDQLFVSASGTFEAASTIKGTFFYPSADIAWQFSDLIKSNILSFGKFRASYGKVGIQPAPYKFHTLVTTGFSSFGGAYLISGESGNPGLQPEVKTEYEIGTDLRLFNNRIQLGVTYYNSETKDVLFSVKANPSSGYNFNYKNAAVIANKGIEIDLTAKVLKIKDFQLSINSNFNANKNKVVDIAGTETVDIGGTSKAVKGYPMSAFYLPGTLQSSDGKLTLDANGFPQVDTKSRVLGDPNPDWRGGVGMTFNWKKLDFSFLFEHSHGGDYINRTRITLYGFGTHADVGNEITLTEALKNVNGVTFAAGTTLRGNIANFGGGNVLLDEAWYNGRGGGLGFNKVNDLYVEDATWTKLRNVTLGYTFSNIQLTKKILFNSIKLSVTGRDLILWTKLKGVDPETNNYGVSNAFGMNYFNNPGTKSVLLNLQVTF
ncbi:SusC/RagA family TonB-linked outer membrane protein [Niastella caeni]|nr:SusC/RagA family TonB-linked outer membrane protein [Niastella caeni]